MSSRTAQLSNGVRIVYLHNPGPVSHCGLMIGAGSRDESSGKAGIAHFIEHVLFKGTKKRKAFQILNRLEIVGGELNAYTTKEETCVHASFLNEHFERATELIADIVFNSQFPDKEIEKEKEVVLDEIHSYMDNPMEQIYDDFECQIFKNHPLGNPVLGTESTVRSFTRKDIIRFVESQYIPDNMVFSYTGNIAFEDVYNAVKEHLSSKKSHAVRQGKKSRKIQKAVNITQEKPVMQAHFITGSIAYSYNSKKRFPLFLMNNILGGPGMNSRLNMNVRERHGYTYNIESAYIPYRDAGLFNIYLATEKKFLDKALHLVNIELKRLRVEKISSAQMNRFKTQLKGQIAIAQENKAGVMLNNAKSILNYNRPVQIDEVFRKIDEITSTDIMEVANEVLNPGVISSLLYKPSPKV